MVVYTHSKEISIYIMKDGLHCFGVELFKSVSQSLLHFLSLLKEGNV